MRKRTRYLLLVIGFVFFLILAPIIILYVRGIAYDFKNKHFVFTGIINVKAEPNKVDVYVNNVLKEKKSGDINFLLPDDYNITLKKDGYFSWEKRLAVLEGMVTWTSPQNNNIYLLKQSTSQKIATEVLDFYSKNSNVIYLTNSQLFFGKLDSEFKNITLSKPVNKITVLDDEHFLLSNSQTQNLNPVLFNSSTGSITDLSNLFISLPENISYNNNLLYYLSQDQLVSYDLNSNKKTIIFENVKSFTFQNNNLYYIQKANNTNGLYVSVSPFSQSQQLSNSLPEFEKAKLFISFAKQIFILADTTLYKINSTSEKITDNIQNFDLDYNNQNLPILRFGEFDYYDFAAQNLNFVTRKNEHLSNLVVKNNIGYAFYKNTSGIYAVELDTRDTQNQYLISEGKNITKFNFYNADKNIIFLEDDKLKTIEIR